MVKFGIGLLLLLFGLWHVGEEDGSWSLVDDEFHGVSVIFHLVDHFEQVLLVMLYVVLLDVVCNGFCGIREERPFFFAFADVVVGWRPGEEGKAGVLNCVFFGDFVFLWSLCVTHCLGGWVEGQGFLVDPLVVVERIWFPGS